MDEPYVVLVRWPRSSEAALNEVPHAVSGDASGKFQFTGIMPGEYRIFSLLNAQRNEIRDPAVLERTLMSAQKVAVNSAGAQSVTLEALDISRR